MTGCYRCGEPGVSGETFMVRAGNGDRVQLGGGEECVTPGCAEPDGSRRLVPPTPAELRRREENSWLARQFELAGCRPPSVAYLPVMLDPTVVR